MPNWLVYVLVVAAFAVIVYFATRKTDSTGTSAPPIPEPPVKLDKNGDPIKPDTRQ